MSDIGQKIISAIREIAEQYPDTIYHKPPTGGCQYVFGGQPSCLVGRALWDLGMIDARLEWTFINRAPVYDLTIPLDLELDVEELDWLSLTQEAQDNGTRWGLAVASADDDVIVCDLVSA